MSHIYTCNCTFNICLKTQCWERIAELIAVDFDSSIITSYYQFEYTTFRNVIICNSLKTIAFSIIFVLRLLFVKSACFDHWDRWRIWHLAWIKRPELVGLASHQLNYSNLSVAQAVSNYWTLSFWFVWWQTYTCASSFKLECVEHTLAVVVQNSELLVLASHDWVEDHLACDRRHNHVVDFVLADKVVLVRDLVSRTFVAIQNVLTRTPEVLPSHMKRSNGLSMRRVKFEELFAFLCYSFDALPHRVEHAELLLACNWDHNFIDALGITCCLAITLEGIGHFTLFALPDFQVLLSSNNKLLQFPLGLQGKYFQTVTCDAAANIKEGFGLQIINIMLVWFHFCLKI